MKKILVLALTAALVLSIAGCNNDKGNADTTTTAAAEVTTTAAEEATTTAAEEATTTEAEETTVEEAADTTAEEAADDTTSEEISLDPEGIGGDGLEPGETVPETDAE